MSCRRATIAILVACLFACGCSSEPRPHPRDKATQDPMTYNPMGDQEKYDVSGGGMLEFDRDAFRKDLNSALSP